MVWEIYEEFAGGGNDGMMVGAPWRGTLLAGSLNYSTQRARRWEGAEVPRIDRRRLNQISGEILHGAVEVHRELGPGLLESTYETCLSYELRERGFTVRTQIPVPIVYKGIRLKQGYRIDMLVEEAVVAEIKTVVAVTRVHAAQLLTHLKHSGHRLGLLLNFDVVLMRDGIKRIVNDF